MADFIGDSADNIFTGGADPDNATGAGGNDQLSGNGGADRLTGDAGADTLNGGDGSDILFSDAADPTFTGYLYRGISYDIHAEADILIGGADDDYIFAGYGDTIDGGTAGSLGDRLFISFQGAPSGVSADFRLMPIHHTMTVGTTTISNINNVGYLEGSNFDDFLVGLDTYYPTGGHVYGRGGNDHILADYYTGWGGSGLFGGDGDDIVDGRGAQYGGTVYGDDGNDTLYSAYTGEADGGAGNDTIYAQGLARGGAGNDHIEATFSLYGGVAYGEAGDDEIVILSGLGPISGGSGADTLTGNDGDDTIASDELTFNAGYAGADDLGLEHDVLDGAGGNDKLAIGYGDSADGGAGSDTLRLSLGGLASGITFDTAGIVSGAPFVFGGGTIQNVETLEYLRGTGFADLLTIATQASLLTVDAGDGNDVVIAGASSVSLLGGNGDDRLVSGIAGDIFNGGDGLDTVDYGGYVGSVSLTVPATGTWAGLGGDQLTSVEGVIGGAYADTLTGGSGANRLSGGAADDTIIGGGGADILDGGDHHDIITATFGSVSIDGGSGDDTIRLTGISSGLADTEISGGAGTDTLDMSAVSAGGNYLYFTDDSFTGGSEAGSFRVADNHVRGVEVIKGGSGPNWFLLQELTNAVTLHGSEAGDFFATTFAFADVMYGYGGNDLFGVRPGDVAVGGAGDDAFELWISGTGYADGGDGTDLLDLGIGWTVDLAAGTARGSIGGTLYTASDMENVSVMVSGGFGSAISGNGEANAIWVDAAFDDGSAAVTFDGLGGNDQLTGGKAGDTLYGRAGDDILDGGLGADAMAGGAGDDTYKVDNAGEYVAEAAGEGFDRVMASTGYALIGGAEIEVLLTTDSAGTTAIDLTGNELVNAIYGNAGANILSGGAGGDSLFGLAGDDILDGGTGGDAMAGGLGDDNYLVDDAADFILENAGEGTDRVRASVSFALSGAHSVESLAPVDTAGTAALNFSGNDAANNVYGNAGANVLVGGGGNDYLVGFAGNDTLYGQDGLDAIDAGDGHDVVIGGDGADYILAGAGDDAVDGGAGDDVVIGGGGLDYLLGGAGNDLLEGETMHGGAGNDTFLVASQQAQVFENAGEGSDRIVTQASFQLAAGSEVEVLEGEGAAGLTLVGNELGTTLYGAAGNDVLYGLGGTDALGGRGGNDVVYGNDGNDLLLGDEGLDALSGDAGSDTLDGGLGADLLIGGADADLFRFASALGGGNVDSVSDFAAGSDQIQLDDAVFAALAPGALAAGAFHAGSAAADADDRIVYDSASGALYYDADGLGGADQIQFVTLGTGLLVTASDFAVI